MALTDNITIVGTIAHVASQYGLENEIVGLMSDVLVAAGFTLVSDSVGTIYVARIINLRWGTNPYLISLTTDTGTVGHTLLIILALDEVTIIKKWDSGGADYTAMNGGSMRILTSINTVVIKIVTLNSPTDLGTSFAFLKMSDALWYCWGKLLNTATNGGILDNITNTIHTIAASIYYNTFENGSYPLIPWMVTVDGGSTLWNVVPLSVYSIKPTNFTDGNFYVDPAAKNYFKYGNLMVTD